MPVEVSVNNPTNKAYKTSDDKFLEVAAKVPGFGGMFKDGDVLKVYLVNPGHKQAAEVAIVSVFGRESIPKAVFRFYRDNIVSLSSKSGMTAW